MHSICEWTDFLCRQFFLSLQARLQVSLQTGKKKLTLAFPGPSQRHSAFLSLPASRFEFQCKDIKEIQKHIQFGSSGPGGLHHPVWAHRVRSWLPLMTRCFQVPGVQESALFQPEAARCHWQSETPRGLHSRSGRTVVDQPCCHLGRGDSLVKPWPLRSFELSRPRS